MAGERQRAANRGNGRRSTGPRSAAGKKRASRNSFRHGLSVLTRSRPERAECIERLARKIAGDKTDPVTLECAHAAAEAEFDLAQVRRVKIASIDRILAFGELESPQAFKSVGQATRLLSAVDQASLNIPTAVNSVSPIPSTEPERTAEAVRRALPELLKLDRYERRAAARRQRALSIGGFRIAVKQL
jgi:hypothetical protein